jgi:hypothetical protein
MEVHSVEDLVIDGRVIKMGIKRTGFIWLRTRFCEYGNEPLPSTEGSM